MNIFDFFKRSKWCKHTTYGEIYLDIEIDEREEISFRVNAGMVKVEWGDGEESETKKQAECFRHFYKGRGIYHLIIQGEKIVDLDIKKCRIIRLEVNHCPTLEFIDCSENLLRELDVRGCRKLYELDCSHNQLGELKLGRYKKLFHLSCAWNNLEYLELSGCRGLVDLFCKYNNIHHLDVSKCKKLRSVNIGNNALDISALRHFMDSLAIPPHKEKGFVVIRNNMIPNSDSTLELKRGWYEI